MDQDDAILLILRTVDRLCYAGRFDAIDRILSEIRAQDLTVEQMLAYLTATLPARTELSNRAGFYDDCESCIKTLHPDEWEMDLVGLR